jgi:hypothetical protein
VCYKDALAKIFEEDTLASPDELVAALDAAGYVIAPKARKAMSEIDHSPCREELLRAELERLRDVNNRLANDVEEEHVEVERLRALVLDACEVLVHYDLPEHAFHYRRALEEGK